MGVELGREVGPELLLAEGAGVGRGLDGSGDVRKGVVNADNVLQKDTGYMEGVFVVFVPANRNKGRAFVPASGSEWSRFY